MFIICLFINYIWEILLLMIGFQKVFILLEDRIMIGINCHVTFISGSESIIIKHLHDNLISIFLFVENATLQRNSPVPLNIVLILMNVSLIEKLCHDSSITVC